jgi:HAE1 family hydrophobic/amphiphilic exporter-1
VRGAIFASTLTSLVVFLPLGFTAELTAAILGDLAETVVFALTCSLGVALFLVPVLAFAVFSRDKLENKKSVFNAFSDRFLPKVILSYKAVLEKLLRNRMVSMVSVLVSFVVLACLLLFVAPKIDRLIIDKPDSKRITLRFTNTEAKNAEELFESIKPIEERLLADYGDRIENLFARMRGANGGAFTMSLKSLQDREIVIRELKEKFPSNRKWRYDISRWDPAELPLPRTRDLRLSVSGPKRQTILDIMEDLTDRIRKLGMYEDVSTEPTLATSTELVLKPRRPVLLETNTDIGTLTGLGRILLSGSRVIEMTHQNEQMDISLGYKEGVISSVLDVEDFLVPVNGFSVPLKHFFDFEQRRGLLEIISMDGVETFFVEADMQEDVQKSKRIEFEENVVAMVKSDIELPNGYAINVEDTQKDINDAIQSLMVALVASLILVFVILGCQFNSVSIPTIIITAVPLGLIGVIVALYVFQSNVSLNSMLGTILLGGIVVNNSILMVDFFKKYRHQFENKTDALLHCCGLRLTPILITTLTTILGMFPIALAMGEGTNVIQPLGIAVSGGLGVSTLLTLFIVPCVINLLPEGSL